MKPVFLRSNQHPVVVESFDHYLRIYRLLRSMKWSKSRRFARQYVIKLADQAAHTIGKEA